MQRAVCKAGLWSTSGDFKCKSLSSSSCHCGFTDGRNSMFVLHNHCPSGNLKLDRGCRGLTFSKTSRSICSSLPWLPAFPEQSTAAFCRGCSSRGDIPGRGHLISPSLFSCCSYIAGCAQHSCDVMNYGCDFGHMLSLISHLDKSLEVAVVCISLPPSPAVVPQGLRTQE